MDAKGLENSIRAQVPGAAGVSAAASFAPLIAAQVRQNVAANLPKAPSVSSIGEAVGGAVSEMAQAAGSMLSTIGGLLFKAREGGAHADEDPRAVRAQLSGGESLAGGVRSGMSAALGQDFSDVRVHTDAHATGMADRFNARAFTVGQDIVFGAGEYQPGSPVGDALIAHELAHVAQQRGSAGGPQSMPLEGAPEDALEADADRVAVSAVTSIWGHAQGDLSRIAQNAVPNLRAGLRLSRCGKDAPAPDVTPAPTTTPAPAAPPKEPPLHEQFTTGPARQGAIDKVFGSSGFDASLLEGGKIFYGGDTGGEGLTYPPLDKTFQRTHRNKPPNKKPYVDIFGGAFAAGWPLLTSTMFHEYQHVKQMHRKPDMLVPGTRSEGPAQETEAYAREIIEAEGKGLDADYIEGTLWRRLNSQGWNKLSKAEKAKLQPLYDKAKAVVDRVTKRTP
jgi:hypothetical protein